MTVETVSGFGKLNFFKEVLVSVDEVRERLHEGNFSYIKDREDFPRFYSSVTSNYSFTPCLVHVDAEGFFSENNVILRMSKIGYRPANFFELLAFRRDNKNYPIKRRLRIISDHWNSGGGFKTPTLYRVDNNEVELLIAYHSLNLQRGSKVLFAKIV